MVAETISLCPSCGDFVGEGRRSIDEYRIQAVVHEGYSSTLCKAVSDETDEPVAIRIFNAASGVDERIANRLKSELENLKMLPEAFFVRHLEIRKSSDGLWYRVSEWVDAIPWSELLTSGRLSDTRLLIRLFTRIASILDGLHQIGHFMPHLILADIIVLREENGSDLRLKIDYKVSRFLDPHMDRPGPMLKTLLESHPDILNNRPLDFRSDIWSLGKLFVELLSADTEMKDYHRRLAALPVPADLKRLIRCMLAEEPDLRPQTMAEVAESLRAIRPEDISDVHRQWETVAAGEPRLILNVLQKRLFLFAALPLVTLGIALAIWLHVTRPWEDDEARLRRAANRYAGSVAFVAVEYGLLAGNDTAYRNLTEGTAFLVDRDGYLLTNRHVACPWLEDDRLFALIDQLKSQGRPLRFHHRVFLWFEGEKAFKRLPRLSTDSIIEDRYHLSTAYRSDGAPRVTIAGVARAPEKTWQQIRSPLKNDFAVLHIDSVPQHLEPLPLDADMVVKDIPRLSPVITLGFPLGSRTQETSVNVSVTTGHVRRTFDTLLQVDTSLYQGNSGGPLIDARGKVIGITSSVAVEYAVAPIPVATLLSDIGMVLPITQAAQFLSDIKAGQFKWNGVIDPGTEQMLKDILQLALQGKWKAARELSEASARNSTDPALVMTAAMMAFCTEDAPNARQRFEKCLSMDDGNQTARFMLFLADWLGGSQETGSHRRRLLALDWRSPYEFMGYVTAIMEEEIQPEKAIAGAYTDAERSWIHFAAGLLHERAGDIDSAEASLRQALLHGERLNWTTYLALSRLRDIQSMRASRMADDEARRRYRKDTEAFSKAFGSAIDARDRLNARIAPLRMQLIRGRMGPSEQRRLLEAIRAMDPQDSELLVELAFVSTMTEDWHQALNVARQYLGIEGRESPGRLRLGLLEPQLLQITGSGQAAVDLLNDYPATYQDDWYRTVAKCLLTDNGEASLAGKAGEDPAFLVTGYAALGLWAEGSGDTDGALRYYKEALGSYMDDALEYELSRERIQRLQQNTRPGHTPETPPTTP
jgi:serine/threonine-protein kinase